MSTIFRTKQLANFTVFPNSLLRDTSLSIAARGALAMILTHSEEWVVTRSWLEEQTGLSVEGTRKVMLELEAAGHARYEIAKGEDGRVKGCVWTFYMDKLPEGERSNPSNRHGRVAASRVPEDRNAETPPPKKNNGQKEQGKEESAKEGGATALALGAGLPPSGSGGGDPTGGQGSLEGEAFSLSAPPQVVPPSPFVAFKTGWFDRFRLRTGEKYDFKVADGVALKRMLDSNSAESLLNLVDRCEDAPNDSAHWSCKRALETVAKFSSLLNSVRCELAAKPMTRPVVRSVPEPHAIREEVAVPVMRF